MSEHAADPRPHQRLAADGRRMREVLSYSRRGSRFTPSEAAAWTRYAAEWVVVDAAVDNPDFSWAAQFGRRAPMIVEVGSGVGEATVTLAGSRPTYDVLALEVWRPGIAATLARLAAARVDNVRLCDVDAAWSLRHLVPADSLAEVWMFFPDPWPKTRHHKRRLVDADFARLVTSRLKPGGTWRLATDWADYAQTMRHLLDAEPGLVGGPVERWSERPVTKFERKGLAAGRDIVDLAYRRAS